jgi:hypothetical protein
VKLFLTVLLAAFLGNLGSLYVMDEIRVRRTAQAADAAAKESAEQQRLRQERGARIREMLKKGLKERGQVLEEGPEPEGGPTP